MSASDKARSLLPGTLLTLSYGTSPSAAKFGLGTLGIVVGRVPNSSEQC